MGDSDEGDRPTIDLTGPKDRNWLNEDPPEPDYVTATDGEIAERWEEYRQGKPEESRS